MLSYAIDALFLLVTAPLTLLCHVGLLGQAALILLRRKERRVASTVSLTAILVCMNRYLATELGVLEDPVAGCYVGTFPGAWWMRLAVRHTVWRKRLTGVPRVPSLPFVSVGTVRVFAGPVRSQI